MEAITEFLSELGHWNWFLAAFVLAALEFVIPGVHFLWFALAAVTVGFLTALTGFDWPLQLITFGIVSIGAVFAMNRWSRGDREAGDAPNLNFRGRQYIGRTVTVATDIVDGRGKVRVGDTIWTAQGLDAKAGTAVKVTGTNGTVLVVEVV